MELLDNSPYDFILNHEASDLEKLQPFVHRTFNGDDSIQFIKCLKNIYLNHNGLEAVFTKHAEKDSLQTSISNFKRTFFDMDHLKRKQNDGKALFELDTALRNLDITDPVKYDFALFGLGVFEGF